MEDVSLYATRIQAHALKHREEVEKNYDVFPDEPLYMAFVDLTDSSNYRIAHGPQKGYVRGEVFFSIVNAVMEPISVFKMVKEIGDAVLFAAAELRPVLESVILIEQTAYMLAQIKNIVGTKRYPFGIRAGIGAGTCKQLKRPHKDNVDYLGTAIDQLARIMTIRSETTNLLIHDEVYKREEAILQEYSSFLTVGQQKPVPFEKSKGMPQAIYYRELLVEREVLTGFREHFQPWKKAPSG